jgi:hypothetical protein
MVGRVGARARVAPAGVVLPTGFDAAQAMHHAKLGGWSVRKEHFATVRTNPVSGGTEGLGVVGAGYTPIQNEAQASILDSIVSEAGAHFETAAVCGADGEWSCRWTSRPRC